MKDCTPEASKRAQSDRIINSMLSGTDCWADADGKHYDMYEMPLSYLKNCLRMLETYSYFTESKNQPTQVEIYQLRDEKKAELADKINLLEKHLNSAKHRHLSDSAKGALSLDNIGVHHWNR